MRNQFDVYFLLTVCGLLGACATTPPPELIQAREAYKAAEKSDASRYDLAGLHQAKAALDQAERYYEEDGDEPRVRDAAYVASRRSELAVAHGETLGMQKQKEELQRSAEQTQAKAIHETNAELAQARAELQQAQIARQAAEQHAEEAMKKLQLNEAAAMAEKERGTVLTISGGFLFQSGQSKLLPSAYGKLDEIASVLREQGDRNIVIEGYTDSQGGNAYNLKLSKQRAESVASYLASKGVARDKLKAEGLGPANPIAPNDTTEGRASNRRVEITIEHLH